jgi:hypothetical protein
MVVLPSTPKSRRGLLRTGRPQSAAKQHCFTASHIHYTDGRAYPGLPSPHLTAPVPNFRWRPDYCIRSGLPTPQGAVFPCEEQARDGNVVITSARPTEEWHSVITLRPPPGPKRSYLRRASPWGACVIPAPLPLERVFLFSRDRYLH